MTSRIIYNITFQLEQKDVDLWTQIVCDDVIPQITDGEIILNTQVNKINAPQSDLPDSYALQFTFRSLQDFNEHRIAKMTTLITSLDSKMRGRYVYFGTMMEVVHYYSKTSD